MEGLSWHWQPFCRKQELPRGPMKDTTPPSLGGEKIRRSSWFDSDQKIPHFSERKELYHFGSYLVGLFTGFVKPAGRRHSVVPLPNPYICTIDSSFPSVNSRVYQRHQSVFALRLFDPLNCRVRDILAKSSFRLKCAFPWSSFIDWSKFTRAQIYGSCSHQLVQIWLIT